MNYVWEFPWYSNKLWKLSSGDNIVRPVVCLLQSEILQPSLAAEQLSLIAEDWEIPNHPTPVFSPHWQISGRESWILWRWCFGEHFNFVNLLSWSTWDEILANQTAVWELRQVSTNQSLTFCQDSYHVIERLKSVICQMFLMLSGGVMRW